MRIGFLFNHDQIHQVAHSLPIAIALARSGFVGDIIVATTNDRLADEVRRLGGALLQSRIRHVELKLSRPSQLLDATLGSFVPAAKLLVYRDNLDFFRSLDMLVVAEKTSLILKKRYGLDRLRIVHTRHGAGDRAIGFDRASNAFDHILCSGPKIRDRLAQIGVDPSKISIVGYPKFDVVEAPATAPVAHKSKQTILYNPHPSPHLSSWYRHGRKVLEFFLDSDDYQLVFAPHVMLFERPFVVTIDKLRLDRPGKIEQRYLHGPNIHFDLGSRASTDMSYTSLADIYLGDVSSQVYEFLRTPRPCVFLNSHGHAWRNDPNFAHWAAGPVIDDPALLGQALREARETHATRYRAIQEKMVRESFDLSDIPSSSRAADVIARLAATGQACAPPKRLATIGARPSWS